MTNTVVLALSLYLGGFVAPAVADDFKASDASSVVDAQKNVTYDRWNAALASGAQVTPELVHANFATVIETNLSSPDADAIISRLSERELEDLARLHSAAPFRNEKFQANLQTQVGQIQQARLTAAFSAVDKGPNPAGVVTNAVPTVDMTLTEVYLEFRTAPVGSLSVTGSLYETAAFAGTRMAGSFGTGYAIGSAMAPVIQTYSPGTWDAIGGTLHSAVQNVMDSWDLFSQGEYLMGLDSLFGGFQMNYGAIYSNWSGDWGFFDSYDRYMHCQMYQHC